MDIRSIGIGLLFAFIWASAFASAVIIVADAAPLAALAFRFVVSGLIGIAIARMMGESWHLTREQWRATIVFGVCQNAIYLGLNFVAMQTVEASLAAVIASTMPLMVAAAGWALLGDRLPSFGLVGLIIGFVGVAVIMSARMGAGFDAFGVGLCVIAAIALTVATLSMRGASSGGNLMMVVGLQMLVGAVALGIASALTEEVYVNLSTPWVLAFVYTTLAPGLLATWLWFTLVQRIGAVRAATFHFLTPFFGVSIAALILGEALGARDVLGVAIIMAGILAVQLSKQKTVSQA